MFEVYHKNGNVRAIVKADDEDQAWEKFRAGRIGVAGIRPKRSNHTIVALDQRGNGGVTFLYNPKLD